MAVGGWWRLAAGGGGWRLGAVGGWRRMAAHGGWRRMAVGWRSAVGGPWGLSLRAVYHWTSEGHPRYKNTTGMILTLMDNYTPRGHSARTVRAQRQSLRCSSREHPLQPPPPATEACMIHSTQRRGCRLQGPGTRGDRRWKTAGFSHSAGTAHGAPPLAPSPRAPPSPHKPRAVLNSGKKKTATSRQCCEKAADTDGGWRVTDGGWEVTDGGSSTGAAASQCVTPRGVRQFGGL